ncbi:MAG: hypothetical protein KatS3mg001_373 [Candidatus Pacearchaeota archaeon]|nr:MAG: hypothetical protein KatS3mg001_373 [Candidatus Pacearchaeota archaeon]
MKNKKGFLLGEEAVKIVIALIALSLLVYLLYSLYSSNKNSKDLELAKESLNRTFEAFSNREKEIQIYNPESWYFISWPREDKTPLSCSNLGWSSCICICKDRTFVKDEIKECDSLGVCLENKENYKIDEKIKIEDPPINLIINYEKKEIKKS